TLSRWTPGFESPWGRQSSESLGTVGAFFCVLFVASTAGEQMHLVDAPSGRCIQQIFLRITSQALSMSL
ncbi:hypothetical protein P0996_03560, partial [Xanthomonas hortorum pv. gardneri]